jgi:phosphotransferase system IIA component
LAEKVGDKVSEGDMLAEIETDKATMESESSPTKEIIIHRNSRRRISLN